MISTIRSASSLPNFSGIQSPGRLLCLELLQLIHAGTMFDAVCQPPRDIGTKWSFCNGNNLGRVPQYTHLPLKYFLQSFQSFLTNLISGGVLSKAICLLRKILALDAGRPPRQLWWYFPRREFEHTLQPPYFPKWLTDL